MKVIKNGSQKTRKLFGIKKYSELKSERAIMALSNLMEDQDWNRVAELDELIKKDPSNAALLVQKGHLFYSKMADDLVVEAFKEAIKIDHTYVDAYFWLAECLNFHLGEPD